MSYIDIAPSILAADFGYLMRDIKKVEGHAEHLHIGIPAAGVGGDGRRADICVLDVLPARDPRRAEAA